MKSAGLLRTGLALTGLALCALAPLAASIPDDLAALPSPSLESMEAPVRTSLEEARERVDALARAGTTSATELAAAYGELGRRALFYALLDLAEPAFANAVRLETDRPDWAYYLGVTLQQQRKLVEAITAFEAALALEGDSATDPKVALLLRLGQVHLLARKPRAARDYFNRALSARPPDHPAAATALYGLGRADAMLGAWESAADHYRRALAAQPGAAEIHQQLGLTYRELGELDRAREHLENQTTGQLRFPDPRIDELAAAYQRGSAFSGRQAVVAGRIGEAVERYRQAVESEPDNASYRSALAGALAQSGELDGAIREYREAVRIGPSEAMSHLRLATALQERDGPSDEALAGFREAVRLAPDLQEAHAGLAGILLRRNQLPEAEAALAQALRLAPEDQDTRVRHARVLLRMGEAERARAELSTVLEADPDNVEAHLALGSALAASGERQAARESFNRALALGPEPSEEVLAYFQLAQITTDENQPEEAIRFYREVLSRTPRYRRAHLGLGELYRATGKPAEAAAQYAELLAIDPGNPEILRLRALALSEAGQADAAEAVLRASLTPAAGESATDPEDEAQTRILLASLQAGRGQLDAATLTLDDGLDHIQEGEPRALLLYNAGVLAQQRGDAPAALGRYRAALELTPDDAALHLQTANLLGQLRQLDEATRHFQRAVELAPGEARAHLGLATAHTFTGRLDQAITALRAGLEQVPEAAPGHTALAHALARLLLTSPEERLRDPATALPLAEAVQSRDPSPEHAETLALALASVGRFPEAARLQEQVLAQARQLGVAAEIVTRLEETLARYQAGQTPLP